MRLAIVGKTDTGRRSSCSAVQRFTSAQETLSCHGGWRNGVMRLVRLGHDRVFCFLETKTVVDARSPKAGIGLRARFLLVDATRPNPVRATSRCARPRAAPASIRGAGAKYDWRRVAPFMRVTPDSITSKQELIRHKRILVNHQHPLEANR